MGPVWQGASKRQLGVSDSTSFHLKAQVKNENGVNDIEA